VNRLVELPVLPVDAGASRPRPGEDADHDRLMRRARRLSILSIGWMGVEAGVAISVAVVAGSVALLGFGLDSLIELVSAATVLWLYSAGRGSEQAERSAQRVVAGCFAALALYLCFGAIRLLIRGTPPDASWPGVAVTAGALVVMPWLARSKRQVAIRLSSAATAGDAAQSRLCALSAAAALVSILTRAAFGWWWPDPAAALAIAGIAILECRDAWRGDACADCAPITAASPAAQAGVTVFHVASPAGSSGTIRPHPGE
jgi:divalent metal cation (Fe/Co/Zn/Cd) transporter